MINSLYIAATGQHVGKTTTTLGLVSCIRDKGYEVGYCKPVGQNHIEVNGQAIDKDVTLFAQVLGFTVDGLVHSPVVIGQGVTREYIEHPERFHYQEDIQYAARTLRKTCDMVVFEGTGHPGVGSVVDVSNADVARLLGAGVIMIAEGGIGNTIDRLALSFAQFRQYDLPIIGVIINKVLPEKADQIQYYVGKKLEQMGVDLLGVIPYDRRMSFPIMETINHAVNGRILFNEDKMDNRIADILAGSLLDIDEFSSFSDLLLVVSLNRLDEAIAKIRSITREKQLEKSPIVGIIITGDGKHERRYAISDISNSYVFEHDIPVISTELDTYGAVVKISRIEVKINTRTPWKTRRAIELIKGNVDVDRILAKLNV
jgi:dethiobiotin synthetase